ncbi:MAG: DUF922 domain-containing protein [Rhodanobacteraceae bacterium]|nr:DUF922 domain-containing protein [Xanthomonadales bacterium]MCP5477362.1 DUF922 domain-containing protein [Rhodanobacteraceae bacterium]HPF73944.1 DUF922 domain-containing protein [Xanthomonadaceae bacterium]HRY00320.1 DUF922 domain-containing protein [Xanthomonadaceae bacterium]
MADFQRVLIAILLAASSSSSPAQTASTVDVQLHVQEARKHYDVAAANLEQLLLQLRVPGHESEDGSHANGLTTTELRMESDNFHRVGECRLSRVELDMTITMTTPRWDDGTPVPETLADEWPRIRGFIEAHEARHRQNALRAAEWLRTQLRTLGGWQPCTSMSTRMNRYFSAAQMRRSLQDNLLDRREAARVKLAKPTRIKRFHGQRPDWMQ